MAGSMIVNHKSRYYKQLKDISEQLFIDSFWAEDAILLESNSRDFSERMRKINENTEIICDYLIKHPQVADVFYPKFSTTENYNAWLKPGGGYSGIFSLILKDLSRADTFYDALNVSKGPSLGTNFTLACPYTILAHYFELEWAESCGVPEKLIRISIGLEDSQELIQRFEDAFKAIS